MARYKETKLEYPTQDEAWDEFCETVHKLGGLDDIRRFFKDIFNRQERLMFVRRLQVAKMLESGASYDKIIESIGVGRQTIARVQRWLEFGRGGYKRAAKTDKEHDKKKLEVRYKKLYRGGGKGR